MTKDLESLVRQLDAPGDPALPSVERILAALRDERFSGTVELKYEAGRVVLLRKRSTITPEHCQINQGETRGHQG